MIIDNRILIASSGMVITNGETYAYKVKLGLWDDPNNYYEITEEEYQKILKEQKEGGMEYGN